MRMIDGKYLVKKAYLNEVCRQVSGLTATSIARAYGYELGLTKDSYTMSPEVYKEYRYYIDKYEYHLINDAIAKISEYQEWKSALDIENNYD